MNRKEKIDGSLQLGSPSLPPAGEHAWPATPNLWFQARAAGVWRIPGGVLLQAPYLPIPHGCPPFRALFEPVPPDRVDAGTLQLGDWSRGERECELPVALRVGPDGKVWAQVGEIDDLPVRSQEAREAQAQRILADFLEAYEDWAAERNGDSHQVETLRSWSAWRLTSWLHKTTPQTPPPMGALMAGVLGELAALGFRTRPDENGPPKQPAARSEQAGHGQARTGTADPGV